MPSSNPRFLSIISGVSCGFCAIICALPLNSASKIGSRVLNVAKKMTRDAQRNEQHRRPDARVLPAAKTAAGEKKMSMTSSQNDGLGAVARSVC